MYRGHNQPAEELRVTNDERSDATRTRILDAAVACFTREGYDATSVSDVCRAAGVSKGAFYHHFDAKQAVFVALLEPWLAELDAAVTEALTRRQPAPQRLVHLATLVNRVTAEGRGRIPMFLEFWRQAAKDPSVWRVTVEPYRRFRSSFVRLVEDGVAEGSLRPVDPDLAALVLVSLGVGLVLQGALDPVSPAGQGLGERAIALLLEGITNGGAS
ncbi:MAG: TetR/AcrR family transcriptional regulator [Spirochaetaceae bacterium]|nr:MAG: TetR/AcrR family transcriptional regulator [Spirochaetaceae bacterium]